MQAVPDGRQTETRKEGGDRRFSRHRASVRHGTISAGEVGHARPGISGDDGLSNGRLRTSTVTSMPPGSTRSCSLSEVRAREVTGLQSFSGPSVHNAKPEMSETTPQHTIEIVNRKAAG